MSTKYKSTTAQVHILAPKYFSINISKANFDDKDLFQCQPGKTGILIEVEGSTHVREMCFLKQIVSVDDIWHKPEENIQSIFL